MEKQGEVNTDYKKRWFVLYSDGIMNYMVEPGDSKLSGKVSFAAIKSIERTTPVTFELKTDEKVWSFRCSSETLCNEWIDAMQLIQSPPMTPPATVADNAPNDDTSDKQHDNSPMHGHVRQTIFSSAPSESKCDDTKTMRSLESDAIKSLQEIKGLDFSIYENPNSRCSDSSDDIPITERCSTLKRLCTASLYFDAINSSKLGDAIKRTLWVKFNEEVYQNVVEDTIHLMQKHDNDIQHIQREWTERYELPKCTVSECTMTTRHYGRGRRDTKMEIGNDKEDTLYAFHQSLHDRVHHFLFHLFEIGMRVDTTSMNPGANDEEKIGANLEGVAVDKKFAAERDHIKKRKEALKRTLGRMDPLNNKFTIQMMSEKLGGVTLLDALFQQLSKNIMAHKANQVRRLKDYFESNSFDSECIEMDIEDVLDSNISNFIQDQSTVHTMAVFVQSTRCMFHCISPYLVRLTPSSSFFIAHLHSFFSRLHSASRCFFDRFCVQI